MKFNLFLALLGLSIMFLLFYHSKKKDIIFEKAWALGQISEMAFLTKKAHLTSNNISFTLSEGGQHHMKEEGAKGDEEKEKEDTKLEEKEARKKEEEEEEKEDRQPKQQQNHTLTSSPFKEFMARHELVMKERKARLEKGCQKYATLPKMAKTEIFEKVPWIYMKKFNFSYCMISKTGSTTLATQLKSLERESVQRVSSVLQSNMKVSFGMSNNREERDKQLKTAKTFIFVRHPFVRLVGSYVARRGNAVGRVRRYARHHRDERLLNNRTNFSAFVNFVIVHGSQAVEDVHFREYWYRCDVCHAHLDWIGRTETSADDKAFIFAKLGVHIPRPQRRMNTHGSDKKAETLFGQLTREQIHKLYLALKLDFELFGYDYRPFLKYAKS